jgi:hypothetical protein
VTIIKVDYDGRIPHDWQERFGRISRAFNVRILSVLFRRTARGYHVECRITGRVTAVALVAAQAIAGSDWRREAFNLSRVRRTRKGAGAGRWNILFERKIPVPSFIQRSLHV